MALKIHHKKEKKVKHQGFLSFQKSQYLQGLGKQYAEVRREEVKERIAERTEPFKRRAEERAEREGAPRMHETFAGRQAREKELERGYVKGAYKGRLVREKLIGSEGRAGMVGKRLGAEARSIAGKTINARRLGSLFGSRYSTGRRLRYRPAASNILLAHEP